jgi:hypothetical protein
MVANGMPLVYNPLQQFRMVYGLFSDHKKRSFYLLFE